MSQFAIPCRAKALLLSGVLGLASAGSAQDQQRGTMHDAIDEQSLRKQVQATATVDALMAARSKPVSEVRPSTESSLFTSSLILSDGQKFTLIPIGSILHLPEKHRARVIATPQGDFTFWPNFLKQNAAWLAAKEVPLEMAKGDAKAAETVLRESSASDHVLVSVYKGGPISILEPAPEPSTGRKP